jgi:hypothetical protein
VSVDIVYSQAKSFQVTDVFGARAPPTNTFSLYLAEITGSGRRQKPMPASFRSECPLFS